MRIKFNEKIFFKSSATLARKKFFLNLSPAGASKLKKVCRDGEKSTITYTPGMYINETPTPPHNKNPNTTHTRQAQTHTKNKARN